MKGSRKPEIMADAAYAIFTEPSRECTGNFFIDDEVLAAGRQDRPVASTRSSPARSCCPTSSCRWRSRRTSGRASRLPKRANEPDDGAADEARRRRAPEANARARKPARAEVLTMRGVGLVDCDRRRPRAPRSGASAQPLSRREIISSRCPTAARSREPRALARLRRLDIFDGRRERRTSSWRSFDRDDARAVRRRDRGAFADFGKLLTGSSASCCPAARLARSVRRPARRHGEYPILHRRHRRAALGRPRLPRLRRVHRRRPHRERHHRHVSRCVASRSLGAAPRAPRAHELRRVQGARRPGSRARSTDRAGGTDARSRSCSRHHELSLEARRAA